MRNDKGPPAQCHHLDLASELCFYRFVALVMSVYKSTSADSLRSWLCRESLARPNPSMPGMGEQRGGARSVSLEESMIRASFYFVAHGFQTRDRSWAGINGCESPFCTHRHYTRTAQILPRTPNFSVMRVFSGVTLHPSTHCWVAWPCHVMTNDMRVAVSHRPHGPNGRPSRGSSRPAAPKGRRTDDEWTTNG